MMTLKELELIKEKLDRVSQCIDPADRIICIACQGLDKAKYIIDREIRKIKKIEKTND